jgi:type IV pilus assembly protein PilY1
MDISTYVNRHLRHGTLFTLTALASSMVVAAPGKLANVPLFATNAVKPNIMLVIDDSGSMDAEILFPSNDGAAWWNVSGKTFVGRDNATGDPNPGEVNFNTSGSANNKWKKYTYLFPNGTGTGNRVYSDKDNDHFAVPPLPQYAYTRSFDYNKAYFNPDVEYKPWPAGGYKDIDPTQAPSDAETGGATFDLTTDAIENSNNNHRFKMYDGMVIPKGVRYRDWASGSWKTATADKELGKADRSVAISYKPAVYYQKVTTGTYSVVDPNNGSLVSGNCSMQNPDHYLYFHARPSDLSSTSVDALGPNGACLEKVEIAAGTPEMQNFANWFSYYRKRHLALRAGVGSAFKGTSGIRVGMFTINGRNDVTMMDFDTQSSTFFNKLYKIDGNNGGTPNRRALYHAGDQFTRTGTDAPITEACQRNYTIHFTDGYSTLEGYDVGHADGDEGEPFADSYSKTLADVAMYYYNKVLPNDTKFPKGKLAVPEACEADNPDSKLDCNKNLHMNTITVGLGAKGTIFGQPYTSSSGETKRYETVADAHDTPPTWPNVNTERDPRQVDDLYHAAVNGRGEMYSASSTDELGKVMSQALKYVKSGEGAGSAASFNTTQQHDDSEAKKVFIGVFDTADWSGDFFALPMNKDGDIQNYKSTGGWSAAYELDNMDIEDRNIFTSDGPFKEWSNLSSAQQADLMMNPDGNSGGDAMGKARLNYLRGDRTTEELYGFRERGSRLGDIVHSQSVYVSYDDKDVIYVGANDGMLHAFSAETGEELFAYIPSSLFSTEQSKGLHYLTDPNYRHRYYVDLTPTVAKVDDETILVGGLRGGGREVFALDITDPDNFTEGDVKWEFTHEDLGYTYSNITLAKMNDGEWAAIFGSGYCNGVDDCTVEGKAQLFIVSLSDGSLIKKISTEVGTSTDPNGLSTPGVADLNADGTADWVYAGDLQGNLWAFDLTSKDSDNWKLAYDKALFKTDDDQPITSEPMIVKHPEVWDNPANPAEFHDNDNGNGAIHVDEDTSNYPNTLVLFGTGQYLTEADKSSGHLQAFYGIWDDGSASQYPLGKSNLQEQTDLSKVTAYRALTNEEVNYEPEKGDEKQYGWYLKLGHSKERVINRATVRNNVVFFDTLIPSNSVCDYGGSGYLMAVNLLNGGRTDDVAFDFDGDGEIDEHDEVTVKVKDKDTKMPPSGRYHDGGMPVSEIMDNEIITNDTNQRREDPPKQTPIKPAREGRLSWEELER